MVRIFGYYISKVFLLLGLWEACVFFVSPYLGIYMRFQVLGSEVPQIGAMAMAGTAAVFALLMSAAMVALALLFYTFPPIAVGRGVLGLSLVIAFAGVLVTRAVFDRLAADESRKRRVLVLGTGVNASRIHQNLDQDPGLGFVVIGYVPLNDAKSLVPEYQIVEKDGPLLDMAIEREVDEIVAAVDDRRRKLPVDEILDCKMSGFPVLDLLTFFEKENACIKIDLLHPSWIIFSAGFQMGAGGLYGKRLFDLAISTVLLTVFAPVMALVALASMIESRGRDPVLFHQVRVGQNGTLFRLHKFRSMRVDAEADGVARWATENDTRITRLGSFMRKTRLDELPQIFNVFKGQMSLVGPRPERPEFVEQLSRDIPFYGERHRVKPGVTGWAQMLYPYGASVEDAKHKLEYDLYYVKHAGVFLDLIILLQTVEIVLLGKGAR